MSRRYFIAASLSLSIAFPAHGQVARIVIDSVVSPAFGGASYGDAGQYETIAGRAFGELDPADRHNRVITDLQFAPRNARGRVEYVATFFIVKPIQMMLARRRREPIEEGMPDEERRHQELLAALRASK